MIRIVFIVSERNGTHLFFTSFHPDNHSQLGLKKDDLNKLILHTKILVFVHDFMIPFMMCSVLSHHSIGVYYTAEEIMNANHSSLITSLMFVYWFFIYFWVVFWVKNIFHALLLTFTAFLPLLLSH